LRDGVSRLRPHFYWPWRGPINADRAGGVAVPDIITDAPAAILGQWRADRTGRHLVKPTAVVH
jgi:hypothetical protein